MGFLAGLQSIYQYQLYQICNIFTIRLILVIENKMPFSLLIYLHPSKGVAGVFPKEQYKLHYSFSTYYHVCLLVI